MAISLHVRHEVKPDRTFMALQAIEQGEAYDYVTQSDRQVTRLQQLGLVEKGELTDLGLSLALLCQQKPSLWADLVHFLHYTLWDTNRLGVSWTYKQYSDAAWSLGDFKLAEAREEIVSSLVNQAELEPDIDVTDFKKEAASLSTDSLRGVEHWFAALTPPAIEDESFSRRSFCPPELLLMATAHIAQQTDASLGIDLLLTPARREAISRLCLLEPAALDRTFDWMLPLYPQIVTPGTTAGAYGRFIRFLRWPTMSDLLRR